MEDLVYTVENSLPSSTILFPDCDYSCLSQYNYVIISNPDHSNSNSTFRLGFLRDLSSDCSNLGSFDIVTFPQRISNQYIEIPHDYIANCAGSGLRTNSVIPSSFSGITIRLTQSLVKDDTSQILTSINQNILLIPATMLIIYFFYCIYRMLLRGRS